MKSTRLKSLAAIVWECITLMFLILLIKLPDGKNVIDSILTSFHIKQNYYGQLSTAAAALAVLFFAMYIMSFRLFITEKVTKIYSIIAPIFMIVTIACLLING
ncbi:MAG: hypothetical protein K6G05_00655 [Lachnospiraceae bacterium]|nr:hypothetical protein [Lachnospiraceae bacterium]